jgi:hypothetical protein
MRIIHFKGDVRLTRVVAGKKKYPLQLEVSGGFLALIVRGIHIASD